MPRLEWDQPGTRYYNAGVDRGVLYVDNKAVAWNGLVSVEERSTGGEITPVYVDGIRVRNLPGISEYEATIQAFYSPVEFDQCDGIMESQYYGFFATNQIRKSFGLSYRTGFANDVETTGSKIHLIYNAMAEPSSNTYQTLSPENEASYLSWDIKALPNLEMTEYISAHYIFDTTKVEDYVVEAFEDLIYGTSTSTGRLPTTEDIQNLFVDTWRLTVTDTGSGYYEISGSDYAVTKLPDYYRISSPTVKKNANDYTIESG